jgi:hypothetical protein
MERRRYPTRRCAPPFPRFARGGSMAGYSTRTAVPAAVTISMLPLEPIVS